MSNQPIFIILPYLRTSQPISIRGIHFQSSDDLEKVPLELKNHLKTLFEMFFLRNDLRIIRMVYAILELEDVTEENALLGRRLIEAQQLIAYIGTRTRSSRDIKPLYFEHATLYLFWPEEVSESEISLGYSEDIIENIAKDSAYLEDHLNGYYGRCNFGEPFPIVEGNRIYPPFPNFWLGTSYDLSTEIMSFESSSRNWPFRNLIDNSNLLNPEIEDRIFTALKWYNLNKSYQISEEVSLLNLAVALECLLNLEQSEALSQRFKETVKILLGSVPRLDSWLEQFYRARSAIVHEGKADHLTFYAEDWNQKRFADIYRGKQTNPLIIYRSLTSYGRAIFQLCLITLLSGAQLAQESKLSSLFIHNRERLTNILKQLDKGKKTPESRLAAISDDVNDLHLQDWTSGDSGEWIDISISVGKRAIKNYLEMNPDLPERMLVIMNSILQLDKTKPIIEAIRLFSNLIEVMQDKKSSFLEPKEPYQTILSLAEYIVNPSGPVRKSWFFSPQEKSDSVN